MIGARVLPCFIFGSGQLECDQAEILGYDKSSKTLDARLVGQVVKTSEPVSQS